MPYVHVDFDLSDFDDQELIDELENRGWLVGEEKGLQPLEFNKEEIKYIREIVMNEKIGIGRDIYDKVRNA